jgi:hypothetical protein
MSDKRKNRDETVDPRVSAAYRELADERTPGHLDHAILNAARGAAGPKWARAVAWLRPAAWVATIGVCFAIVIEIALLPDQEPAGLTPVSEDALPATATKRRETAAPQAAEPAATRPAQKLSRGVSEERQGRADEAEALNRIQDMDTQEAVVKDETGPFLLQSAPAPASARDLATERYCDESQTADPNTWLACILELERQGLLDAARLERDLLTLAFPPPELP